ncbi:phage terminase large subunit [Salmonella enterica]|nr:phage terminase large subunit [Salmonella enterica]EIP0865438.1 phage terminase large subunit [Salmonella enterica]EJE5536216.1 phage terminase large subunit [Salmonella enterica]EJF1916307.1 phage terminase large subunit [Salmonella enterica]
MVAKKLDRKAFRQQLAEYIASLRQTIETECLDFDVDPAACAERKRCTEDPANGYDFFVSTYFPHYIRHASRSQLHNYLFERLPQIVASPEGENDAIAAPRGEAKSTLVSQLFVLWCIIRGIKHYPVIVMDSIDQAYPMLEAIKAELLYNPRLRHDFPDVCVQGRVWQMGTIVTANNIKVTVAGSGKKLRGLRHGPYRPDLVILDDIENDENVQSPEQRDKLDNWLKKTVLPLGEAGGKTDVVYIGTILHYDSVLSRTLSNPMWRTARFKAIIRWPDNMKLWETWEAYIRNEDPETAALFQAANEAAMLQGAVVSWAARPLLTLMKIRVRDGHGTFDSEYQNDPVSGEDAIFAGEKVIKFWTEEVREWVFFGACDPSLGKFGNNRRDPSAILVGGFNPYTGILDVVVADIRRRVPDKIIADIIEYQRKYHCLAWSFESVQFQEFLRQVLVDVSARAGVPVPAVPVIPSTDKILRIESLQPHVLNGLIRLHASQSTLLDQLRHFPKADHDDGPDALHMLWTLAVSRSRRTEIHTASRHDSDSRFGRGAW